MTAQTLRDAANLMRSRAKAAIASLSDNVPEWHSVDALMGDGKTQGDAEHIVSWTPDIALAVADLLDRVADTSEAVGADPSPDMTAVATAYLATH